LNIFNIIEIRSQNIHDNNINLRLGDIKELDNDSSNGNLASIKREGTLNNNKNSCCGY